MNRRSLLCACAVYAHAHASVCIYAQVSLSLLEYIKIKHRSDAFNKHSGLAIFDELG